MENEKDRMDVYVLLDRTGSMAPLWTEAVSSVNAYVKELAKDGIGDRVTLAAFDSHEGGIQFDVLRDFVLITEWQDIKEDEVLPRGMTPLFDALARLISRAEVINNEKTAIVVMTDGQENASKEVTRKAMKASLDRVRAKNWQVNFLGADFDGFVDAHRLGVAKEYQMNFAPGSAEAAMSSTARKHSEYRNSRQVISYSKEDRDDAREDDVGKK
jgi:Mg-chelatase subunit ChlD